MLSSDKVVFSIMLKSTRCFVHFLFLPSLLKNIIHYKQYFIYSGLLKTQIIHRFTTLICLHSFIHSFYSNINNYVFFFFLFIPIFTIISFFTVSLIGSNSFSIEQRESVCWQVKLSRLKEYCYLLHSFCIPVFPYKIRHFFSTAFRRDAFFDGRNMIVPFDFVNVGLNAPV